MAFNTGVKGDLKKTGTCLKALLWALPMNLYPIIPTPMFFGIAPPFFSIYQKIDFMQKNILKKVFLPH
jgi:hypothetical protein